MNSPCFERLAIIQEQTLDSEEDPYPFYIVFGHKHLISHSFFGATFIKQGQQNNSTFTGCTWHKNLNSLAVKYYDLPIKKKSSTLTQISTAGRISMSISLEIF